MTAILFVLELILELSGANLSFRRRFYGLFALLAFRALADIVSLGLFLLYGGAAAGMAAWIARAIQYLLLIALSWQLVSSWLWEKDRHDVLVICALIGAGITAKSFLMADTLLHRFADAEVSAVASAGVLVALGWLMRKTRLERAQAWIASGLMVSLAGNGICAVLWHFWAGARFWYPAPAILALLIWNWAAIVPKAGALWVLRRSLGQNVESDGVEMLRFGPESVGFVEARREMVN